MNPERRDFLNLHSPPGRSNSDEAAWKLGFEPDHIAILANEGMLKPLGNDAPPGSMKFFFTADIEEKKNDRKWMSKATDLIRLKIKEKNERAAKSRALRGFPKGSPKSSPKGSVSVTNGNAANGNSSNVRHS